LPGRAHLKKVATALKVIRIATIDGIALVAYAGLGRVGDTQVSRWACRVLRGLNWPLEKSLERLSDAAQRKMAPILRKNGLQHVFIAGAIREGKHFLYSLDIVNDPSHVVRTVPEYSSQILFRFSGSGSQYIPRLGTDRFLKVARLMRRRERGQLSEQFIAAELAKMNAEISEHALACRDDSISADCVVVFESPPSTPGPAVRHWFFDQNGGIEHPGMAVSEIYDGLMKHTLDNFNKPTLFRDDEVRRIFREIPETPDEKLP
jgi:hypothetical protein